MVKLYNTFSSFLFLLLLDPCKKSKLLANSLSNNEYYLCKEVNKLNHLD